MNILQYDYLYNGGGVGVLDINNDGLMDLYFCGNMVDDRLYLNKGNFEFKDVTDNLFGYSKGWSSGVLIFDVNADGWDDIYISRSGPDSTHLGNLLFINQQNGTFEENSSNYGLDTKGHFTQAAVFDMDIDGDLDLYLISHPGSFNHSTNLTGFQDAIRNGKIEADKLLENVGGIFVDISKQAGITEFGYSLGLSVSDINLDGYPDLFISNDFDEPDHLFINQQNNTFKDEALTYFKHTSNYSMGADIGDINNDGLQDYISVDMAFPDHFTSKMNMSSMDLKKFYTRVGLGWGYQYMHNMLHLNTGNGSFQEIAHYAGIANSDWSWGPILADFNGDGLLDLFITNGYKRDTKNNDLQNKLDSLQAKKGSVSIQEFLDLIPSRKVRNKLYLNQGGYRFKSAEIDAGLTESVNSNGAVYADLDNDGDLDLITNNVDQPASVYENKLRLKGDFICLEMTRKDQSKLTGSSVELITNHGKQIKEWYWSRGYASSLDQRLFFYLKPEERLEELRINDKVFNQCQSNTITKIRMDQLEDKAVEIEREEVELFKNITIEARLDVGYDDNKYNDFDKESLLPHQMSAKGPKIAVGDFDKNGFEDFIMTSAVGEIPKVYLQNNQGKFKAMLSRSFYNHHATEDGDVYVFDVNGDKNLDLIITSGGYQYEQGDTNYQNRLYIGNGLGMFGYVKNALPKEGIQSSTCEMSDFDKDGDLDLLVCGDVYPGKYPYSGRTKLYQNTKGFFKDVTSTVAPQIEYSGMINDAVFADYDGDGDDDLLMVGEWTDILFFTNQGGSFVKSTIEMNLKGWWSSLYAEDIDADGDIDFLIGNAGTNNKFNPTKITPLEVYANDFDSNGSLDIVLAKAREKELLPIRGKECSSGQMPFIDEKFPTFEAFASADLGTIYGEEKLDQALQLSANEFKSGWIENKGESVFTFHPFPAEAQFSFINDFEVLDINQDGMLDILFVGNRYETEVETSRFDAGIGGVLIQMDGTKFEFVAPTISGFYNPYNAKSSCQIKLANGKQGILIGNSNDKLQLFQLNN